MTKPDTLRDYLSVWMDAWLSHARPENLHKWRKYYGNALENWELPLAHRLLLELRRHDLGNAGKAHVHLGLAGLYLKRGNWEEGEKELLRANKFFTKTKDMLGRTWVLLSQGNLYSDFGRWAEAEKAYKYALKLYVKKKDKYGQAQTLVNIGAMYFAQSRWAEATEAYRDSLDIFLDVGDSLSAAMSLAGLGNILTELGKHENAIECYQACLKIFKQAGNINGQISTLNNMAKTRDAAGDYGLAAKHYAQSLALAQKVNDLHSQAIALDNLGVTLNETKDYQSALQAHQRAFAIYQSLGDANMSASLNHIGNVYRILDNYSGAESAFNESLRMKSSVGDFRGQASVFINLALLKVKQYKWEAAKTLAQNILTQAEFKTFDEPRITAKYLLGLYYANNGDIEEASKSFVTALIRAANFHTQFAGRLCRSLLSYLHGLPTSNLTLELAKAVLQQIRNQHRSDTKKLKDFVSELEQLVAR